MPAHEKSLLLPSISAEADINAAIAVISQNDAATEQNLAHISSLTDPVDFSTLLWVLDLKHLCGSRVSTLFANFFGSQIQPFVDHVMQLLPCQLCGEVHTAENVLQMYGKLKNQQDFFAAKFGVNEKYSVSWQLEMHHRAMTPVFFQHGKALYNESDNSAQNLGQMVYLQTDEQGRLFTYLA